MIAYFDGGARGNPGPAGAGVSIQTEDGTPLFEGAFFLGEQTNNAAEYNGLLFALQFAANLLAESVELRSDSELVVRQVTGDYRVKSPTLQPLYEQAQLRLLRFRGWTIRHVPRESNKRADELANIAMDRGESVIVHDPQDVASETPTTAGESDRGLDEPAPQKSQANQAETAPPTDNYSLASVRVSVSGQPEGAGCIADAPFTDEQITVAETFPSGTCVYAAAALAPTILAMIRTEAMEAVNLPVMTVRCANPACRALFCVSPNLKGNGASSGN